MTQKHETLRTKLLTRIVTQIRNKNVGVSGFTSCLADTERASPPPTTTKKS